MPARPDGNEAEAPAGAAAPVPILANPQAGPDGEATRRELAKRLEARGLAAEVRAVEPAALADALAREVARGAPLVGVCGGDGTLVTAAGVLAGGRTALLPIPGGTLNHFARRLLIPDLDAAVRALAGGEIASLPVGVVDERIFLNTATFGLYADVVRHRERLRRWVGKWPGAVIAFAVRIVRMRRLRITLEVEGKRLERRTPLVWIGLGWGSFPRVVQSPERRRRPDLEIVVVRPAGRLGWVPLLVRLMVYLLHGRRPVLDEALEVIHARRVVIHAHRPIGVTLDGEVLRLRPPIFVAVQDGALSVLLPPDD